MKREGERVEYERKKKLSYDRLEFEFRIALEGDVNLHRMRFKYVCVWFGSVGIRVCESVEGEERGERESR